MKQFFHETRQELSLVIGDFLDEYSVRLGKLNRWSGDFFPLLKQFSMSGKMIRGGLVYLGAKTGGKVDVKRVLSASAAIEILHSGMLIHDDIMDGDRVRRGNASLHHHYEKIGKRESLATPEHFGSSMGICAGNIAYFLAVSMLSGINFHENDQKESISFILDEILTVGLGQMEDLYLGMRKMHASRKEVLETYRLKTARYTFSLPLCLGARIGGAKRGNLELLEKFGENLGVAYQVRDDELGLFNSSEEIGKSTFSDLREGKKTLHHTILMERCSENEQGNINSFYGHGTVEEEDCYYFISLLEKYGIRKEVGEIIESHLKNAEKIVEQLDVTEDLRKLLRDLIFFTVKRNR